MSAEENLNVAGMMNISKSLQIRILQWSSESGTNLRLPLFLPTQFPRVPIVRNTNEGIT